MSNAYRDENGVPTIIGVRNTDGSTITRVKADSTSHALAVDNNTTGSDNGPTNAPRDENNICGLMAVSSADGVTPIPLYVDSTGKLLINSI